MLKEPTTTFCAPVETRRTWGTQRECMHGASCVKYGCPYKHPITRAKDCPDGERCQRRDVCQLHHPRSASEIPCSFGRRCDKPHCPFAHDVAKTPMRFRKPCMHGAFCVKFGCGYAHPTGRMQDCEFGVLCTDKACPKLHPRPSKSKKSDTSISEQNQVSKFQVGQQVQAQYKSGTTWRLANVVRVRASGLTLQFMGWNDVADIPFERIRHNRKSKMAEKNDIPPGFSSLFSRGAAVATGPSSPRFRMRSPALSPKSIRRKPNKVQSEVLVRLERLKQAAIAKEDFLLANSLKEKMKKVNDLEIKKAAAVRTEDFLLAMEIKKQITQLTASTPIGQETKQECGEPDEELDTFSLFETPMQYKSRQLQCDRTWDSTSRIYTQTK